MYRLVFLLIISILPLFQTPTPVPTDCKPADVITHAQGLKSAGNEKDDLDTLTILTRSIRDQIAACTGLIFKGGKSQKLIGPFKIPKGMFVATVTSDDNVIMRGRILEGKCKFNGMDIIDGLVAFSFFGDSAKEGGEVLIDSEGCTIVLIPMSVGAKWTIGIAPF